MLGSSASMECVPWQLTRCSIMRWHFTPCYCLGQGLSPNYSFFSPIEPKILSVRYIRATPEFNCSFYYYLYLIILINYLNNNHAKLTMFAIIWLICPGVI